MPVRLARVAAVAAALLLAAPPVGAIIPGEENDQPLHDPDQWFSGLDWSGVNMIYDAGGTSPRDGTVVSVGYFYLLTARHFYTAPGDKLLVNGDEFEVVARIDAPPDPGADDPPDIRLLKLRNNTNPFRPLPGFYGLFTGEFSAPLRDDLVLVGTGLDGIGRSGYYIELPDTGRARRWGTNRWEGNDRRWIDAHPDDLDTSVFRMEYDSPLLNPHEVGLGWGDSGSGAFINVAGYGEEPLWQLAGLNLYRDGTDWRLGDIWAARIPDYADWIYSELADDRLPGDVDLDGDVDANDYLVVKEYLGTTGGAEWWQGDFDGDRDVDAVDFSAVETNFGYVSIPHPSAGGSAVPPGVFGPENMLPEPASAALLAAGLLLLAARRRRARRGA